MNRPAAALSRLALSLAALSPLAGQTWLETTQDDLFTTTLNWDTGVTPIGTGSVATFGSSSTTVIQVPATNVGTLLFTADAPAYTFLPITRFILGDQGIVNQSAFAPTFNLGEGRELRLVNSASLGDARVNLAAASGITALLNFQNPATSAGGATITAGYGGEILFGGGASRTDASGARIILDGGRISLPSSATVPVLVGSLTGDGLVDARLGGLTTGHLDASTTFAGQITGAGAFNKVGAGTFTLTGQITQATTITVQAGALALAADDRLGTGAAALTLDGGTLRPTAAFDDLRALIVGDAGGALDTQGFDVAHSTGISGAGTLQKLGSGTLTLAAANTHSGGTRLSAGTLALGHDDALGTGALILDGGAVSASGGPRTLANAVTLQADATVTGAHPLAFTGAFTLVRNRELTVAASAPLTLAGGIAESGGPRVFARYGSGEFVLTGASTHTGGTLLAEGLTRINNPTGSAFGTGAVTLAAGATLTGAGTFSGAFQNHGTYAPGNSPALVTLSSFSQGPTGVLEMELASLARGTGYDALDIAGTFQPDGTLVVLLLSGFAPSSGDAFDLFDFNPSSIAGTFATLDLPALAPGLTWDTSALHTTGVLAVTGTAIPEPAACATLSALAGLAFAATRRRRPAAPNA